MQNRTLYFGDNLEILRKKIPDETFDLIYLDPPFNSSRSYNVLFKEGLQDSQAQIRAFEDSWHWTRESKQAHDYLVRKTNQNISNLMVALAQILGHNDVLAYLSMMTVRLIELHRVLKKTGSLYLHCDPTASHYLKIVMDVIFGKRNFRNEIVWHYKRWSSVSNQFQKMHDIIFWYSKSKDNWKFNKLLQSYSDEKWIEDTVRGVVNGKLVRLKNEKGGYIKREKQPKGVIMHDVWEDINFIPPTSKERLGYPTQKPETLLERILKASSDEGDLVLDPFCGCGTTVAVAEKLNRKWIGIDITMLAINLIKKRLREQFEAKHIKINIDGLPKDLTGARALAKKDPFEFEYWALSLINAMPANGKGKDSMKGADKGIDGILAPIIGVQNGNVKYGKILVQVKSGAVQRNQIATLKGDIEREKALAGVFITLEKPTRPMLTEAVSAGEFKVHFSLKEFPKIQILTIEELLRGKQADLPLWSKPYHKKAQKVEIKKNKFQNMLML